MNFSNYIQGLYREVTLSDMSSYLQPSCKSSKAETVSFQMGQGKEVVWGSRHELVLLDSFGDGVA